MLKTNRRIIIVLSAFFAILFGTRAEEADFSYIPELHGVFRGRWEVETADGYSHFQVRNARVSLDGKVAPVVAYRFNVDLCDRGKILFLDGYATLGPFKGFAFNVGQFRMPFGVESFRGPGAYYFSNRSYIGKHVNNYRAVGVSAGYTVPKVPLTFEVGAFNPTVMDDHMTWVKKYAYAGRVVYKPGGWVLSTGMESLRPADVRINLAMATVGWGTGPFYVEGEYMARWYTNDAHKTTQSFNFFANYDFKLPKGIFDIWSVQARFDGMTDLASGFANDPEIDGRLLTTQAGRNRLTVGTTLDYKYRKLRAAIRLNYEKCWYRDDKAEVAPGAGDVFSAELIVKF